MIKVLRAIHAGLVLIPLTCVAGVLTILFGLFSVLKGSRPGKGDRFVLSSKVRRLWGICALRLLGIRVRVGGPGLALLSDNHQGLVITSNHQSALDIIVLAAILPNNSFFFSKREVLFVPFLGWGAAFANVIYVNRQKGAKDESALRYVNKLLQRGDNLIIFPEGTRSRSLQMKSFKRGAFVMAIALQKPVLPVSIQNSAERMGPSNLYFIPGELRIWIDLPVKTDQLTSEDRFSLAEEVHQIISKNLDQSL
jgi:1-acyl-sn-glycerol-3-phosphate acyltransferase